MQMLPPFVGLSFLFSVMFFHCEVAALDTTVDPDSRLAAESGITILRGLIKDGDPRIFGFKSFIEAESMLKDANKALGVPLRIYGIQIDSSQDLRKVDPEDLLVETNQVIYPVVVGDQVRTALTVGKEPRGKQWVLLSIGPADFAKMLMKQRRSESRFAVRTHGVTPLFLASGTHEELLLMPLADIPMFGVNAGVPLPATDVFSKLAPKPHSRNDNGRRGPNAAVAIF